MTVCDSKKVLQQESELQSSNPLPITNYQVIIPTLLPLYLIMGVK